MVKDMTRVDIQSNVVHGEYEDGNYGCIYGLWWIQYINSMVDFSFG